MRRHILLMCFISFFMAGCQTISQSSTPSLFEIKSRLSDGTVNRCSSKTDRSNKVKHLQLTSYQFAVGDSGWVRASGKDPINHLEGKTYLNVKTGEVRCYPTNVVPPDLPSRWESLTEQKASELLDGGSSKFAVTNNVASYKSTPARPSLPVSMQGFVQCTDLKVKVPVVITSSMIEHDGGNLVKLWFRSEKPRYKVLDHEYTLKCGVETNSCRGRFDNDQGDGSLTINDNVVRLELSSDGQTCIYQNN